MWISGNNIPRKPGFVSVGSRRYAEWQTLAEETTSDPIIVERRSREDEEFNAKLPPAVVKPDYPTPTKIL